MDTQTTRAELLRRAALGGAAIAAPGWLAGTAFAAADDGATIANGNKPPVAYQSMFTSRIAMFPRVAYYPLGGRGCAAAVAFVIDELLVGEDAATDPVVRARLVSLGAFDTGVTVFAGLTPPPSHDVQMWRLKRTPGRLAYPDVAAVVWKVRQLLRTRGIDVAEVAPNHVLVPSANWHSCPFGPPEEAPLAGSLPAPAGPTVDVVVIDSGYLAVGPIAARVEQPVEYGQWFGGTPVPGKPGYFKAPYKWSAAAAETPDADGDHLLDALVAHAGFVAGVIAQACPEAKIAVVDHNAAFVANDDADTPVATEASVARSLWKHRNARVINVGFAFPTLPNAQLVPNAVDMGGPPSWTFGLVLAGLDTKLTMLVAPAGNQACPVPQYPAAFHAAYPNVLGVGSLSASGQRSDFSNYGPWVACCTEGEQVLSTFVAHWQGGTEEAEPAGAPNPGTNPVKLFTSGWAHWSGTSFAAPKVAAAIANGVSAAGSALAAWQKLQLTYSAANPNANQVANVGMGTVMSGLPPT